MQTLWQELRYGTRSLLKRPTFTLLAVITLGLGIGANTTIFSLINALILSPPRITDPERVVALWRSPKEKRTEGFTSYLDLQDWHSRSQSFEEIAGYKPNGFTLANADEVERVPGMRVTANFFPLLKINPFRGRTFHVDEEKPNSEAAAIISYEFWRTRFGDNEKVLGQHVLLNDKPHTIVGILPPGFEFPLFEDAAVWTTVAGEGSNLPERGAQVLLAIGRLKPGVAIEQAQAEMAAVAASLEQDYPQTNRDTTIYLTGVHEQIVGKDVRRALWLLLGAVGFILLIACANTANLLLVRASERHKEIAIRAALGAGRWRIARQLITESFVLSILAGGLGLLITVWGLNLIKIYAEDQLPRLSEVRISASVLIFTFVVSIATGILFSLVPALKTSRPEVNEILKSGTKAATSGRALRRWRDALVVSEIALSLILLVGAGLMIKSFARLVNVSPGFDPQNVLTGRISLNRRIYEKPADRVVYINQTLERLRAIPGVASASFVAPMPFGGGSVSSGFKIQGRPQPEPGGEPEAGNRSVTPQYFQTIKIPLIKGRYFNEQDTHGGVGAAIINHALAQRYFANEDPIGKRIFDIGANQNEGDPQHWEIVGVVGDVHHSSLTKEATPEIYLPYQQNSWTWGNFLVRTTVDPATIAQAFREQIRAGDKTVPVTNIKPLTEAISETVAQPRFYTFLFGVFGAMGLLLTVTGVYGLISYTVAQRTPEIGIRIALGATRQSVMRMVVKQGMVLAITGVAIGLALSVVLARVIVSLLFEVKPTDFAAFSIATGILLVAAVLASYIPARRATKVDPLIALRYE